MPLSGDNEGKEPSTNKITNAERLIRVLVLNLP
jgi:hypothetical protein